MATNKTTNEIRRALIVELSRVTDYKGMREAFQIVAERYAANAEEVARIYAAVIRELRGGTKNK